MSDESNINFDAAEKYSYVYADGKYSKLGINAFSESGCLLVKPTAWSYAETHSYVKVDPTSVVDYVPENVKDIYAKVVYIANMPKALSEFENDCGFISNDLEKDPHFQKLSASFALLTDVISLSSTVSSNYTLITENIESLSSTVSSNYALKSYVDECIDDIYIPSAVSEFENDAEYATSSFVIESIPTKISEFENDSEYVNINDVNSIIDNLENDVEQYVKSYVENSIPTTVSYFENDAEYVPLSSVQQMLSSMENSFNLKMIAMELRLDKTAVINVGNHNSNTNNIDYGDRQDESIIIQFSPRTLNDASNVIPDYTFEEIQQQTTNPNIIVQMNSHQDEGGNFILNDRQLSDSFDETIEFNYRN